MYQPERNLIYQYDASGQIIGFTYYPYSGTATQYFFGKNAQGDVICIYDANGTTVARYYYDAWGACTVAYDHSIIGIADINPIRYRSYYYDAETGWYYLQSRYYDPAVGRFISPDDPSLLGANGDLLSFNLYAYCSNNPVNYADPSGHAPEWWQWLISGATTALGIALCFVPGGQALGVGLIVSGAMSFTSNILSATGTDSRTASIITNVLSTMGGIALCFTPFAAIGASMIGSGALGMAGGYLSESLGGSFEFGSAIGNIIGGIIGCGIYKGIRSLATVKVNQPIGAPFNPQRSTQIGVDPNTLKISRILNPGKYLAVKTRVINSGMYGVIEVLRDGTIIDGNHRVAIARLLGIAVDVFIR